MRILYAVETCKLCWSRFIHRTDVRSLICENCTKMLCYVHVDSRMHVVAREASREGEMRGGRVGGGHLVVLLCVWLDQLHFIGFRSDDLRAKALLCGLYIHRDPLLT